MLSSQKVLYIQQSLRYTTVRISRDGRANRQVWSTNRFLHVFGLSFCIVEKYSRAFCMLEYMKEDFDYGVHLNLALISVLIHNINLLANHSLKSVVLSSARCAEYLRLLNASRASYLDFPMQRSLLGWSMCGTI